MGKETWPRNLTPEINPGPGDYDVHFREFGKESPRYTIKGIYPPREQGPSPPILFPTKRSLSPRYTIRPKTKMPDPSAETPGPSYVPPPFASQSIVVRYPKRTDSSPRRKPTFVSYSQDPFGPAHFDTRMDPGKPSAQASHIGSQIKTDWLILNNNPSGAAYTPQSAPSSPRHSIGVILPTSEMQPTPGPSDYPFHSAIGGRPMSIHIRHRELSITDTPGPGSYNVDSMLGKEAHSFSIRPRTTVPTSEVFHAPMADTSIRHRGGISIGVKPNPLKESETPGPGQYNISGKIVKKVKVKREKMNEPTPRIDEVGPGQYSPDYSKIFKQSPRFSFGDRNGSSFIGKSESPGPGDYDIARENASPRFTIKGRTFIREGECATAGASLVVLPPANDSPKFTIRRRERLRLIAE